MRLGARATIPAAKMALREIRNPELPSWPIVSWINAGVIEFFVHSEPFSTIYASPVRSPWSIWKGATDLDFPLLLPRNLAHFVNNFIEILILTEEQGHIELTFPRTFHEVQRNAYIDPFLLRHMEGFGSTVDRWHVLGAISQ